MFMSTTEDKIMIEFEGSVDLEVDESYAANKDGITREHSTCTKSSSLTDSYREIHIRH